jgi:hypothetical protein
MIFQVAEGSVSNKQTNLASTHIEKQCVYGRATEMRNLYDKIVSAEFLVIV